MHLQKRGMEIFSSANELDGWCAGVDEENGREGVRVGQVRESFAAELAVAGGVAKEELVACG